MHRIAAFTALLIVTATLTVGTLTFAPSVAGADVTSSTEVRAADARGTTVKSDFLRRINDLRRSRGLRPLVVHSQLASTAQQWTSVQVSRGALAHDPGLASDVSGWTALAENVGTGSSADSIWRSFVNSPTHLRNLLNPSMTHMGVGTARDSRGRIWTTHRFMRLPTRSADVPAFG
jgi:uncharacterized protein YkwD